MASNSSESSGSTRQIKKHKEAKSAPNKKKLSGTQSSRLKDFNDIFFNEALDQTADFSGGFTPYRKISRKKQNLSAVTEANKHQPERVKNNAKRNPKKKGDIPNLNDLNASKTVVSSDDVDVSAKFENSEDISDSDSIVVIGVNCGNDNKKTQVKNKGNVSDRETVLNIQNPVEARRKCGTQTVKIGNKQERSPVLEPLGDHIAYNSEVTDTKPDVKLCHTCDTSVPWASYKAHISQCLGQRFQHGKKIPGEGKERNASRESEFVICQFCQEDITSISIHKRQQHVNQCLEKQGLATPSKNQSDGHVTIVTECGDGEEYLLVCHLCGKDLGHLNSRHRTQHVNRCFDKKEEKEKETKERAAALEHARNKVLDCPICGQHLKTINSRKTHLKKCANTLKVPLAVLKDRVKQQEEEHQLMLAAGIVPVEKRSARGRSRKGGGSSRTRNADNGPPDEATQLAMALSSSLKEEEERKFRESLGEFSLPSASTTTDKEGSRLKRLDAFSVLMTPSKLPSPEKKRGRKKKKAEVIPQLVLTSHEQRAEKLGQKMASVLIPQEQFDTVEPTPPLPQSRLSGCSGREVVKIAADEDCQTKSLWGMSSLTGIDHMDHSDVYYVSELVPPISPCQVRAGSKIKRMSIIPGREALSQEHDQMKKTQQNTSNVSLHIGHDSTLVASTQTAVLLAELASNTTIMAENGNTTVTVDQTAELDAQRTHLGNGSKGVAVDSMTPLTGRSSSPQSIAGASGFCQPEVYDDKLRLVLHQTAHETTNESSHDECLPHLECLLSDMGRMVDNATLSDLQLRVKDNKILHVHKFILAARCPRLLKQLVCGIHTEISLENNTYDGVLALLKYLYTCDINVPPRMAVEVKTLSLRLDLAKLASVCERVIEEFHLASVDNDYNIQDVSCVDQDLNDLLKEAWGSSSEESDNDTDKALDNQAIEREEEEIEELYEFMATQRRRSQNYDDEHEESSESGEETLGEIEETADGNELDKSNCICLHDVSGSIPQRDQDKIESVKEKEHGFMSSSSDGDASFTEDGVEALNDSKHGFSESGNLDNCIVVPGEADHDGASPTKEQYAEDEVETISGAKLRNFDECSNAVVGLQPEASQNKCVVFTPIKISQDSVFNSSMTPDLFGNSPGSPVPSDQTSAVDRLEITNVILLAQETPLGKNSMCNKVASTDTCGNENQADSSGSHLFDSFLSHPDSGIKQRTGEDQDGSNINEDEEVICLNSPDVETNQICTFAECLDDASPVFPSQRTRSVHSSTKVALSLEKVFSPKKISRNETTFAEKYTDKICVTDSCSNEYSKSEHLGKKHNTDVKGQQIKVKKFKFVKKASQINIGTENASKSADNEGTEVYELHGDSVEGLGMSTSNSADVPWLKPSGSLRSISHKRKRVASDNEDVYSKVDKNFSKRSRTSNQETSSPVFRKATAARKYHSEPIMSDYSDKHAISNEYKFQDKTETVSIKKDHVISEDESELEYDSRNIVEAEKVSPVITDENISIDLTQGDIDFQLSDCTAESDGESLPDLLVDKCDSSNDVSVIELDEPEITVEDQHTSQHSIKDGGSHEGQSGDDGPENSRQSTEDMGENDVWEGFDDAGGFTQEELDGLASIPCTQVPLSQSSGKPLDSHYCKDHKELDYDPPTDFDDSALVEDSFCMDDVTSADSALHTSSKEHWKTPKIPRDKKDKKKKPWNPPSPFTPMPNYDGMATPDLKDKCKKFGIRAMPKKKMRTALKHIYQETHQYETDSECDSSFNKPSTSANSVELAGLMAEGGADLDSSGSDILEEAMAGDSDKMEDVAEESYISSTPPVKGKDKDAVIKAKKDKIREYILSHEDLHLKVLMYEPIDLEDFRQDLKEAGINIGCGIIMDALDELNVQFSMRKKDENGKTQPRGKQRGKGKQPKGDGNSQSPRRGRPKKKT